MYNYLVYKENDALVHALPPLGPDYFEEGFIFRRYFPGSRSWISPLLTCGLSNARTGNPKIACYCKQTFRQLSFMSMAFETEPTEHCVIFRGLWL